MYTKGIFIAEVTISKQICYDITSGVARLRAARGPP